MLVTTLWEPHDPGNVLRVTLMSNLHNWLRSVSAFGTGECSNKECPFLHIDPESKIKDCPWYDRGFCKHGMCLPHLLFLWMGIRCGMFLFHLCIICWWMYGMWPAELCVAGPLCRHRHTRRVICVNYLVGFCPEGPACKFMQWVCSRPALQLCISLVVWYKSNEGAPVLPNGLEICQIFTDLRIGEVFTRACSDRKGELFQTESG